MKKPVKTDMEHLEWLHKMTREERINPLYAGRVLSMKFPELTLEEANEIVVYFCNHYW